MGAYDCRMFDELTLRRARPGAVRRAGFRQRRGADARLRERGVAAADRRDRRAPLLQPLAGGDLAQGRNLGQRAAAAPAPLRLRRRRDRRPRRADRSRLPHRRAILLLTARSTASPSPAAHEALRGARAHPAQPRRRAARGQLHGAAARRPEADRREGRGGGRGGGPRRPRGVRRARRRGGGRPPVPPERPARPRARCRSRP